MRAVDVAGQPSSRLTSAITGALLAFVAVALLPGSAGAAFPGDNGKIAFNANQSIYTINPDGSGETLLTNAGTGRVAWSPDGAKIALISNSGGTLWVMNGDGSGLRDLGFRAMDPAWSPDGTQLAFTYCGQYGCFDLYKANADGSGMTPITRDFVDPYQCDPWGQGGGSSWPPCPENREAAWSPQGDRIAFSHQYHQYDFDAEQWLGPEHDMETISPNGGGRATVKRLSTWPDWSPDGQKLVYSGSCGSACTNFGYQPGCRGICVVNADGSGQASIRSNGFSPAWSPDGRRIAFNDGDGSGTAHVYQSATDGTDVVQVTNTALRGDYYPDWQPLPPYPRPIGASPVELSFVPAYRPCETAAANSTHGAPLEFPSCSNPTPTSSTVTLGSNAISIARIVVCPANSTSPFCNPTAAAMPKPDVRFTGSIRDVRCRSRTPHGCRPGDDYDPDNNTGPYTDAGDGKGGAQPPCFPSATSTTACVAGADLTEVAELPGASLHGVGTPLEGRGVRITDRSGLPATVVDIGFPVPLDCLPTSDPAQGSTCGVNTTANALVPGVVKDGDAAVWQIGQVELKDSGLDGVRGNSDDQLFATQGVFLP